MSVINQEKGITIVDIKNFVKDFFFFLLKRWWTYVIVAMIAGILGYAYFSFQKPKYVALCTFVLDDKSGSTGGLASLASSFGVDVGGILGGGGSLFANDNLLDILRSRRILETVLLSNADQSGKSKQTLADLYLDFSELREAYSKKERTANVSFPYGLPREKFNLVQDSILYVIYKNVSEANLIADRTSKKTQIFKVQITSLNENFSKLLAERIVAETRNLYTSIKIGTTQKNIDRLQNKADSLLLLLNGKSYQVAESQVLNANVAFKTVGIPAKFASRNEAMLGQLYSEVIKNLESAKTMVMIQTPVMQMLDNPTLPLEDNKSKKSKVIVVSIILSFVFYTFILAGLFLKNLFNSIKIQTNE